MTPYARLRSLSGAEKLLKPGVDFALLDAVAAAAGYASGSRRPNTRTLGALTS